MLRQSGPPIYFTKLVIENIRCFRDQQELNLVKDDDRPTRWTLILGDNGVGKTTLLQSLAHMRPKFNPPPDDDTDTHPKPVEPEFAKEADDQALMALIRSDDNTHAQLHALMTVGVPLATQQEPRPEYISTDLSIERVGDEITTVNFEGRAPSAEFPQDHDEPLVLGYGAGRHPSVPDAKKHTRLGPVESLFKVEAELLDAEEILCQLDYSSLKGHTDSKKQLDRMKSMLAAILPGIPNPESIDILGPTQTPVNLSSKTGVHVKTPYGNVPLRQMSLGDRTVFAWTVDIAWRLIERYPDSPNPLEEPAVVMVDEIDLHLHPRWQREIRERLTNQFPNVQFIATAHSPLMAQSALDANLAVVQQAGDHSVILNDPIVVKSWRLDQLITSDLFDLRSARSPEVEKTQKRRSELIEKPELSADEQTELAELDRIVLAMPTESGEDEEAMRILREAATRVQSNKGG